MIAPDEISSRIAGRDAQGKAVRTTDATAPQRRGALRVVDTPPEFKANKEVRVRDDLEPTGHTRLRGYVRGRTGHIDRVEQAWIFPDTHAHGLGEQPTWVYAVRFEADELWPNDRTTTDTAETTPNTAETTPDTANTSNNKKAAGGHAVFVDLFEPYLEET